MKKIEHLFNFLANNPNSHSPNTDLYLFLKEALKALVNSSPLTSEKCNPIDFGEYGRIVFPFYSMGKINSLDLFGLDEIILFSFYLKNKSKYKRVADMGANIGLHTLLMLKLGWDVTSFEPDPVHVKKIKGNLKNNGYSSNSIVEAAITGQKKQATFTRVMGNRTGSHIQGNKTNVYGDIETFQVKCLAFKDLIRDYDFVKMDIEGAEVEAIINTTEEDWASTDLMLEIGSIEGADKIYHHAKNIGLSIFTQKLGWKMIRSLNDMPTHHSEGSAFLSAKTYSVFPIQ